MIKEILQLNKETNNREIISEEQYQQKMSFGN
jgi:hypothetical protein